MKCGFQLFFIGSVLFVLCSSIPLPSPSEHQAYYWMSKNMENLESSQRKFRLLNKDMAKNVILFVGGGMGLTSITAGRIFKGQKENVNATGEEYQTVIDRMPFTGLVKTYSVDYQTPDSAAAATALLCGFKTKSGMIGVDAKASDNCTVESGYKSICAMEFAKHFGKSTGIVTTTRVQHAATAAAYAKTVNRSWYSDSRMPNSTKEMGCKDISLQLLENAKNLNVVLGGGRAYMKPYASIDREYPEHAFRGERKDRRDLIEEWIAEMDDKDAQYDRRGARLVVGWGEPIYPLRTMQRVGLVRRPYEKVLRLFNQSAECYHGICLENRTSYVWTKEQFDSVDPDETDYLLGLFEPFDMQYSVDREDDGAGEPSLAEMTEKAINILKKNRHGFFLLVEAGRLDHAHHSGWAHVAMEEFLDLERSIQVAKNMTSNKNTLVIVTGDHGHVFTIGGGYPVRGNPVLGLSASNDNPHVAMDGMYHTSAAYANGPGGYSPNIRPPVHPDAKDDVKHRYQAAVPLPSETHSSEDVPVFASGPMSHLVTGVHEQSYLAEVMMYAACLGPHGYNRHCVEYVPVEEKKRRPIDSGHSRRKHPH